uniref:Reverse transcriptase zinc-binding domain-containing protein n=1 Tax=Lactuca sativa TaxID=4236 RepID=A0A9R1XEJ5_LACSA|nr:hypothetical protein LSAT_V11C400163880 [Lactuca sativa]
MWAVPSIVALSHRGISVPNCSCQFCDAGIDDTNHILLDCPFDAVTLRRIFNWCNLPWQNFRKVGEIVSFVAILGFFWCVWRARNDCLFNNARVSSTILTDNVLIMFFGWLKHQGNYGNFNWTVWMCNPFDIL